METSSCLNNNQWEYGPKKSHDVSLLDTLAQSAHNQRQATVSFELQCDLWSWWHPTLVLKQAEIRNKMLAETCPNRETKTHRNRRNKTNKQTNWQTDKLLTSNSEIKIQEVAHKRHERPSPNTSPHWVSQSNGIIFFNNNQQTHACPQSGGLDWQ
jgi:hypothetical protein